MDIWIASGCHCRKAAKRFFWNISQNCTLSTLLNFTSLLLLVVVVVVVVLVVVGFGVVVVVVVDVVVSSFFLISSDSAGTGWGGDILARGGGDWFMILFSSIITFGLRDWKVTRKKIIIWETSISRRKQKMIVLFSSQRCSSVLKNSA